MRGNAFAGAGQYHVRLALAEFGGAELIQIGLIQPFCLIQADLHGFDLAAAGALHLKHSLQFG